VDQDALEIEIPYAPRKLQAQIHEELDQKRFAVVVCHRRFGKTVMAINQLIKGAVNCALDRPRFGYIAPTFKQAKAVAWDYLKHYTAVIPGIAYNEAELRADFPWGARIRLYGAENADESIRGQYFDGCVLDEFGLMQGRVWSEVVRPALSDRTGWALFIGTPNGKNAFWDLRKQAQSNERWYVGEYPASVTQILPPIELEDARQTMTADEYAQEFECSFEASVRGAIFATELAQAREQKRITRLPYDPMLEVHTAWDLGVKDSTAIWFYQQLGSEVRLIDYYEASGEGLQHYATVLDKRGYKYGKHFAPHDIEVREMGTGKSRLEIAGNLGVRFDIAKRLPLHDGLNAARMLMPRCYFDQDKCGKGLEALQNYRKDFNTRLDEFKETPVHDWASHAADAFRYLAISIQDTNARKWKPLAYDNRGYI
jgi:phage terminase large subunit